MADDILNMTEEQETGAVEQVVAKTEQAPLRIPTTLKGLIEALVFAAKEPLTIKQLQALYESQGNDGEERRIEPAEVTRIIEELNLEFESAGKPYRIIPLAGGFQFATQPVYAEWLGKLYKEQSRRKLSQSSIESLSIIAYKQPISKPEIESIRGVNCDYVLKTLLEKELVTIVGRAPTPGRPLLYGTTREFLKHFGLNDVSDLPRPREIEEILGESQFEAERRMLEAKQGLGEDQKKDEEDFKSRLPHIPKRKASLDETVKIVSRKKTRELKIRSEEGSKEPIQFDQTVVPENLSVDGTPPVMNILSSEGQDQGLIEPAAALEPKFSEEVGNEPASGEVLEQDSIIAMPKVIQPLSVEVEPPSLDTTDQEQSLDDRHWDEKVIPSVDLAMPPAEDSVSTPSSVTFPPAAEELPDEADVEYVQKETPEVMIPDLAVESSPVLETPLAIEDQELSDAAEVPLAAERDMFEAPEDLAQNIEDITSLEQPLAVQTTEPVFSPVTTSDPHTIDRVEIPPAEQEQPLQSPSIEILHEDLPEPPPVAQARSSVGRQQSPHPKTPWQTWKEKIQGFIKKLFG